MKLRILLFTLLTAVGLALGACGGGAADTGSASGIVRDIDPAAGRITLEHEEIPGMMKAMTMAFEVADPTLLEGLEEGDRVHFEARYAEGRYTVTAIEPR